MSDINLITEENDSEESTLKNVFDMMHPLKDLQSDAFEYSLWFKDRSRDKKFNLFNDRGELEYTEKNNDTVMSILLKVEPKNDEFSVLVSCKLDRNSPKYKGEQKIRLRNFVSKSFDYRDFSRVIEKCIDNFDSDDDIDSMKKIYKKAGCPDEDEFINQISAQKVIKDEGITENDVKNTVKDMINSSKYGLKYFDSMISGHVFKYDKIADDVFKVFKNGC